MGYPSLGGLQFFWDLEIGNGWRLQEAAFNHPLGRYRLINQYGWVIKQGTLEDVEAAKPTGNTLSDQDTIVMIHGLGRTRHCFRKMAKEFRNQGYQTFSISYPSTHGTTGEHGERLISVLLSLPTRGRLFFVGHSFGCLILRLILNDPRLAGLKSRIKKAVLLGPPNRGSMLGEKLSKYAWFRLILGAGGQSVLPNAVAALPDLDISYLVVAGVRGNGKGFNPFLPGEDDLIVRRSEVELPNAEGILEIQCSHSFLMADRRIIDQIGLYFS